MKPQNVSRPPNLQLLQGLCHAHLYFYSVPGFLTTAELKTVLLRGVCKALEIILLKLTIPVFTKG